MNIENKKLGRGLGSLLSPNLKNEDKNFKHINISEIDANHKQPRKKFNKEELEELASSIKTNGILQPIVVRPSKKNRYEIIAGERRWRAAQLAGIHEIPSFIKEMEEVRKNKSEKFWNQIKDMGGQVTRFEGNCEVEVSKGLQDLDLKFK